MGRRNIDKSASELYRFFSNGGLPTNGNRCDSGVRKMFCLSVFSVAPTKILNMSNNSGRLHLSAILADRICQFQFVCLDFPCC